MQPTTITTVSLNKLDSLYAHRARKYYSSEFWQDVTDTSWEAVIRENAKKEKALFLRKIRRVRVLVNRLFIGQERDIMFVLLHSASPIADVANITGMCLGETYRKVYYLRRIMTELYNYFDKGTYREAEQSMRNILTPGLYVVFHICVLTRNISLAAKLLNKKIPTMQRAVERIGKSMKKHVHTNKAVADLYTVWKRINIIRRTYYGYYKKDVVTDLDKV